MSETIIPETDSLGVPLFVFEGPSEPNPGPPHPAAVKKWEEYRRLIEEAERESPEAPQNGSKPY